MYLRSFFILVLALQVFVTPLKANDPWFYYALARSLYVPAQIQQQIGIDLAVNQANMSKNVEKASFYLELASEYGPSIPAVWLRLFELYSSDFIDEPETARSALINYSQLEPLDNSVVNQYIANGLARINSASERMDYLQKALPAVMDYPQVKSDVHILIGDLLLEKGMIESSIDDQEKVIAGARDHYYLAFGANPYNLQAVEALLALPINQPASDVVSPAQSVEDNARINRQLKVLQALQYRIMLFNNPGNIEAALALIDTLVAFDQYELALRYYGHTIKLMEAIRPEMLPEFHLHYQLSAYLAGDYELALELGDKILESQPQDIAVLAIKAKALDRLEKADQSEKIYEKVNELSKKALFAEEKSKNLAQYQELTWYYCFIKPSPAEALTFAQLCYDLEETSKNAELLAYAQMLNGLFKDATNLIKDKELDVRSPVVALIIAEDNLEKANRQDALDAIEAAQSWGVLLAQRIKMLERLGIENNDKIRHLAGDMRVVLVDSFDDEQLAMAFSPADFIQCSLRLQSSNFAFGKPLMGEIFISNQSRGPIALGPEAMVNPQVLVVAYAEPVADPGQPGRKVARQRFGLEVPVGWYNMQFNQILEPRTTIKLQECFSIGRLNEVLSLYPQQGWEITFRAYIDPVILENGRYSGLIEEIQPLPVRVSRQGIIAMPARMSHYYRALSSGTTNEKIEAIEALAALLVEENLARRGNLNYQPFSIDQTRIKGMLAKSLEDSDSAVRARAILALVKAPLDNNLMAKMASLLRDPSPKVRFVALDSLSKVADLSSVLPALARDEDTLVQRLAHILARPVNAKKLEPSNASEDAEN